MAHWLIKSEPSSWSWQQQIAAGAAGTPWNGVRNHQAKLHLMAMKIGDEAFFYHSNEGKEIVGIVEVTKPFYPDPTDASGKFGMVDVKAVKPFVAPVSLEAIKHEGKACQNGARQQFPAVRAAGERSGMANHRQNGWGLTAAVGQSWSSHGRIRFAERHATFFFDLRPAGLRRRSSFIRRRDLLKERSGQRRITLELQRTRKSERCGI